ncbi:MAG: hypothetical protein GYA24_23550 [Candidatus Lokiarchaeota archaeon]|nr:hypothetical protein [Candidatus Lokiarchaeota archaeon]
MERGAGKGVVAGSTMFSSPCIFHARLDTCGEDPAINYRNCQPLHEYVWKK